jgi:hypothetical protein
MEFLVRQSLGWLLSGARALATFLCCLEEPPLVKRIPLSLGQGVLGVSSLVGTIDSVEMPAPTLAEAGENDRLVGSGHQ